MNQIQCALSQAKARSPVESFHVIRMLEKELAVETRNEELKCFGSKKQGWHG